MLTRHFHRVLSPSCVAEDSWSGNRFQVSLDRGSPCLQLASSSSAPRAGWYGKEKVLDQPTFGTSCSMSLLCTSSASLLVRRRRRHSSTDRTQSLRLMCRMRRMLSLSKTSNILSYRSCLATVEQNSAHYCLVEIALLYADLALFS